MAFSDSDLQRFFSARTKTVEIAGAQWNLRELSGYQLQQLQAMLLTTGKNGAEFDATQLAPHYAQAIIHSVTAIDGEPCTLTIDQVERFSDSVFKALREAIDQLNKVEETADEGKG